MSRSSARDTGRRIAALAGVATLGLTGLTGLIGVVGVSATASGHPNAARTPAAAPAQLEDVAIGVAGRTGQDETWPVGMLDGTSFIEDGAGAVWSRPTGGGAAATWKRLPGVRYPSLFADRLVGREPCPDASGGTTGATCFVEYDTDGTRLTAAGSVRPVAGVIAPAYGGWFRREQNAQGDHVVFVSRAGAVSTLVDLAGLSLDSRWPISVAASATRKVVAVNLASGASVVHVFENGTHTSYTTGVTLWDVATSATRTAWLASDDVNGENPYVCWVASTATPADPAGTTPTCVGAADDDATLEGLAATEDTLAVQYWGSADDGRSNGVWILGDTTYTMVKSPTGGALEAVAGGGDTLLVKAWPLVATATSPKGYATVSADGTVSAYTAPPLTPRTVRPMSLAPGRVYGVTGAPGWSVASTFWSRPITTNPLRLGASAPTATTLYTTGLRSSAGRVLATQISGGSLLKDGAAAVAARPTLTSVSDLSGPFVLTPTAVRSVTGATVLAKPSGTKAWAIFGTRLLTVTTAGVLQERDLRNPTAAATTAETITTNVCLRTACRLALWGDDLVWSESDTTDPDKPAARNDMVGHVDLTTGAKTAVAAAGAVENLLVTDGYATWSTGRDEGLRPVLWTYAGAPAVSGFDAFALDGALQAGRSLTDDRTHLRRIDLGGRSAPRALAVTAASKATLGVTTSWSPRLDATKALGRVTMTIRDTSGAVVRSIAGAAAPDGSVRGLPWDLRTTAGAVVPAGTYRWSLSAAATDGSGALLDVVGKAAPTGTLVVAATPPPAMTLTAPAVAAIVGTGSSATVTYKPATAVPSTVRMTYTVQRRLVTIDDLGNRTYSAPTTWLTSTTGGSGTATALPGSVIQVRAFATNSTGQTGTPTAWQSIAFPLDERDASATWNGAWTPRATTTTFKGTLMATTEPGATWRRGPAYTNKIVIIGTRGPYQSEAVVYIDGVWTAVIDTKASRTTTGAALYTATLPYGSHTISILNVATPDRATLSIDAIAYSR